MIKIIHHHPLQKVSKKVAMNEEVSKKLVKFTLALLIL